MLSTPPIRVEIREGERDLNSGKKNGGGQISSSEGWKELKIVLEEEEEEEGEREREREKLAG